MTMLSRVLILVAYIWTFFLPGPDAAASSLRKGTLRKLIRPNANFRAEFRAKITKQKVIEPEARREADPHLVFTKLKQFEDFDTLYFQDEAFVTTFRSKLSKDVESGGKIIFAFDDLLNAANAKQSTPEFEAVKHYTQQLLEKVVCNDQNVPIKQRLDYYLPLQLNDLQFFSQCAVPGYDHYDENLAEAFHKMVAVVLNIASRHDIKGTKIMFDVFGVENIRSNPMWARGPGTVASREELFDGLFTAALSKKKSADFEKAFEYIKFIIQFEKQYHQDLYSTEWHLGTMIDVIDFDNTPELKMVQYTIEEWNLANNNEMYTQLYHHVITDITEDPWALGFNVKSHDVIRGIKEDASIHRCNVRKMNFLSENIDRLAGARKEETSLSLNHCVLIIGGCPNIFDHEHEGYFQKCKQVIEGEKLTLSNAKTNGVTLDKRKKFGNYTPLMLSIRLCNQDTMTQLFTSHNVQFVESVPKIYQIMFNGDMCKTTHERTALVSNLFEEITSLGQVDEAQLNEMMHWTSVDLETPLTLEVRRQSNGDEIEFALIDKYIGYGASVLQQDRSGGSILEKLMKCNIQQHDLEVVVKAIRREIVEDEQFTKYISENVKKVLLDVDGEHYGDESKRVAANILVTVNCYPEFPQLKQHTVEFLSEKMADGKPHKNLAVIWEILTQKQ